MSVPKIVDLAVNGLITNEVHHKQWYLEEILKELGYDLEQIVREEKENGYEWEEGIAP